MRGADERSGSLFSYVDLEARVPKGHPLRAIREIVNEALWALEDDFAGGCTPPMGRPSILPEKTTAGAAVASLLYDPFGAAIDGAAGVRPACSAGSSGWGSMIRCGTIRCSRKTATGCSKARLR